MEIRNDMGVRVYMETKKENKNLGSYPLCISVRDFNMELAITNDSTSAGSSGSLNLLEIPSSPAIEEYQSETITESTQTHIEEGQVYQDKQTVAAAMKNFSVMHKFQFKVKRSSHRSYWLICVAKNRKRTAVVVGSMVVPKYCDPKTVYTPKDIQTNMLSEHGLNLSYMQAWRAKEKALQFLRGNPSDSYSKLPKYFYILEEIYHGSVVKLKKTADDCFLYAFVALCTSISGWQHCRPVVVVDGTFLKSAYRGIMLIASTVDAAGTIFPLAYAVVDSENDASWKWFFEQFKEAYGERPSMCVVSDRHESILKATSVVYPGLAHYSCMWHIWTNIRSKFKKGHLQLHELYFATARSYTMDEFNERILKIEEVDPRVKSYLYDIGYHRWSRVHTTMNRTFTMTSNIAESLNAVTKEARELLIFDLLEYIRTLLERWTKEKLLKAKGTFTYLGYKFNKELDNNNTLSQKLRVRASTDHMHTVLDGVKRYIVCLENKKCSCGQFQLDELPCAHVLAALRHRKETYENYCSPYYTRKSLLLTCEMPVNPLPDESKWDVPQHILDEVVKPSTGDKRQPGRPHKERYKTFDEIKLKKYKVSCGNCGGEGHNKRTCKNAPKKK
ncbi:protein FAR1-RELATED SEQUENCE 5-like [Nicotiana sylvestris]|uniref:protein FAR1-RELATED SEQUENCE 5-like n=1 Tax=Nicotiana sylvestris TaxID=4096 RepID=UPI00388C88A1